MAVHNIFFPHYILTVFNTLYSFCKSRYTYFCFMNLIIKAVQEQLIDPGLNATNNQGSKHFVVYFILQKISQLKIFHAEQTSRIVLFILKSILFPNISAMTKRILSTHEDPGNITPVYMSPHCVSVRLQLFWWKRKKGCVFKLLKISLTIHAYWLFYLQHDSISSLGGSAQGSKLTGSQRNLPC